MREKEIIDKTVQLLIKKLDPDVIYLFGSRAKGNARKGSDFDFAVEGCLDLWKKHAGDVKEHMEEFLGLYSADVQCLEDVQKEFADIVKKTGVVLFKKKGGK